MVSSKFSSNVLYKIGYRPCIDPEAVEWRKQLYEELENIF